MGLAQSLKLNIITNQSYSFYLNHYILFLFHLILIQTIIITTNLFPPIIINIHQILYVNNNLHKLIYIYIFNLLKCFFKKKLRTFDSVSDAYAI